MVILLILLLLLNEQTTLLRALLVTVATAVTLAAWLTTLLDVSLGPQKTLWNPFALFPFIKTRWDVQCPTVSAMSLLIMLLQLVLGNPRTLLGLLVHVATPLCITLVQLNLGLDAPQLVFLVASLVLLLHDPIQGCRQSLLFISGMAPISLTRDDIPPNAGETLGSARRGTIMFAVAATAPKGPVTVPVPNPMVPLPPKVPLSLVSVPLPALVFLLFPALLLGLLFLAVVVVVVSVSLLWVPTLLRTLLTASVLLTRVANLLLSPLRVLPFMAIRCVPNLPPSTPTNRLSPTSSLLSLHLTRRTANVVTPSSTLPLPVVVRPPALLGGPFLVNVLGAPP